MRPRGSVIRLVAERKITALRTEMRQVSMGQRSRPLSPGSARGLVGCVGLLTPLPCLSTLSITSGYE